MSYPCPRCHDVNTRSLPMVYQRGFGSGGPGLLPLKYAPPEQRGIKWWIAGLLLLAPTPFVLVQLLTEAPGAALGFLLPVLMWGATMGWGLRSALRYNKTEWPELVRRWKASFLCMACEEMFQPTESFAGEMQ